MDLNCDVMLMSATQYRENLLFFGHSYEMFRHPGGMKVKIKVFHSPVMSDSRD